VISLEMRDAALPVVHHHEGSDAMHGAEGKEDPSQGDVDLAWPDHRV